MVIPEAIGNAIRDEEEAVPGLTGYGSDLGFDELMSGAEGFVEDVFPGVGAGFAFG